MSGRTNTQTSNKDLSRVDQFSNLLDAGPVQVHLAGEERVWHVHKKVLLKRSTYLAGRLGDHQMVFLDDMTDYEGFQTVLFWLYQKRMPKVEMHADDDRNQFSRTIHRLMSFVVQAEKYKLTDAANLAGLDQILDVARLRKANVWLVPSVVGAVFCS